MRFPAASAALLLAAALARADPPKVVEVPRGEPTKWVELRTPPGRLLVLSAEPASKWLLVDEDGAADLRPFEGGKLAAFCSPTPGRHKLLVTSPEGSASRVAVVVGDTPPEPGPKPPEPKPDPLRAKVKAAFDADLAPVAERKKHAAALAELYRQIGTTVCPDPAVTGPTMLFERARASARILVGPDALLGVRRVVGEELAVILPVESPLTADQRDATAGLFARLAEILDTL